MRESRTASGRALLAATCLALVAPALLGSGCGLKKLPADKRQFVLDVTRPGGSAPGGGAIRLYVRPVRVSPMYESSGFVYKKGDGTFEQDFYNEFFSTPGYILTEELRQWLSGAPFVKQLTDAGTVGQATHVLATRVNALYGDYSGTTPKAVLEIEFTLLDKKAAGEISFHKRYSKPIEAGGRAPDDLVGGWTQGLEQILRELEQDLADAASSG